MKKRLLSLMLALVMVFSVLPVAALAAGKGNGTTYTSAETARTETGVTATKSATVNSDGTVTITLTAEGTTTGTAQTVAAADVVLVMDTSGSMKYCGGELEWKWRGFKSHWECTTCDHNYGIFKGLLETLFNGQCMRETNRRLSLEKAAAINFVDTLIDEDTEIQVGVAAFADRGKEVCALGHDEDALKENINALTADGGTNYDEGLMTAASMLEGSNRQKFIIFLSDGEPEPSQYNGKQIADMLKAQGITIMSVGIDMASHDSSALENIASSKDGKPMYYSATLNALNAVLASLTHEIEKTLHAGENAVMTDVIDTANFELAETTLPSGLTTTDNQTLTWNIDKIEGAQKSVSFKIRPTGAATGVLKTNSDVNLVFNSTAKNGEQVTLTEKAIGEPTVERYQVTYTDGVDNEEVFEDQVSYWLNGQAMPEFAGTPSRTNYEFKGWIDGPETDYTKVYVATWERTAIDDEIVVTVKGKTDSKAYNGDEQTFSDYEVVTISDNRYTENDFTYNNAAVAKGTNVGEYPMGLTAANFTNTNSMFTNVTFVVEEDGKLTITPAEIKITADSGEKVYDGTALTKKTYTVEGTFYGTDGIDTVTIEGSQTDVGESENKITGYTLTTGTNANNYTITTVDGKLKVTPVTDKVLVKIKGNTLTTEYNGLKQSVEGYTVTIDNPLYKEADFTFSGTAKAEGTEPQDDAYLMGLKAADFQNNSKNFTNVVFEVTDGWLKITDEPTHNIEIELTKTIRQTGNAEPLPTAFTFRVEATDETGSVIYTTDITSDRLPKGSNNVALNWKILNRDVVKILRNAKRLTLSEVDKGETGWKYDKTVYELLLRPKAWAISLAEAEPETKYEAFVLVNNEVMIPVFANEYSYNPIYVQPETTTPLLNTSDHVAYVIGYPDGGVHPNATITRAEVATIFFRMLNENVRNANYTKENSFTDVPADKWYSAAISTMAKLKIVTGDPDGSFRPNDCITRAEFATIAARFDDSAASSMASFSDIAGHWAARYISRAAELGWIKGYSDNTFRPKKDITRAEAMAMINRVLNRNPASVEDLLPNMNVWNDNLDTSKWYYLDVQEATNSHDYFRKYGGNESWVQMIADPDWKALER